MSAKEVVGPTAEYNNPPVILEPHQDSHAEHTHISNQASEMEPIQSLPTTVDVVHDSDDLTVSSDQSNGNTFGEDAGKDAEAKPSTLRAQTEEEDVLSEGTDVYEEDTSWRHSWKDKDLAERRKKAPKRVKQYSDYIELMEDRVAAVEEQLRKLNNSYSASVPGMANDPADQHREFSASAPGMANDPADQHREEGLPERPPSPPKQLQLGIAHLKWDKFNRVGLSGKHVIDVLVGDVRLLQSFNPTSTETEFFPCFLFC